MISNFQVSITQRPVANLQPVRQRYYTHTGAIFCRLGNNNTESDWQSADGRVTSDHCRVTVQQLFSKFFLIAWSVGKTLFTVGQRSRDLRPLSRDRSATFFTIFQIAQNVERRCLTVSRRSRDLRPLSRDRSATFSEFFLIAWNVDKTLFDSRPTVVWPTTTVAWPYSDFFPKFS